MPSELIVDFSRLKCTAESGKTVRFAPLSEFLCYEAHHKSDYSKLFYNSQDYRELMIQNRQAVIDVRMKLLRFLTKSRSKNHADSAKPDAIFGNEKLLTPKIVKKIVLAKKNHRCAVLQEQARQNESGQKDPEAIARAPQKYSKAAVSQARKIGSLQSITI